MNRTFAAYAITLPLIYAFIFYNLSFPITVHGDNEPVVDTVITTTTSGGDDTGGDSSTGITIPEAPSTATVYVRGQASHGDGCPTIVTTNSTWNLKLYRTGASGAGSGPTCDTADKNDCYDFTNPNLSHANCEITDDYTIDYEFNADLYSWADPTDTGSPYAADTWTAKVSITSGAATGTGYDTFEVGSTIALTIESATVDYGTLELGALSEEIPMTLIATGNRAIDAGVVSAEEIIACNGVGSSAIPLNNMRFSTTATTPYGDKIPMATTSIPLVLDLPARTNEETAPTSTLYFQLQIPATGISGVCGNTISVNAAAH